MTRKSLRRTAALAALATASGLAVPLLAAPAAYAATPPTGVTVTPTTQTATAGTSATITATLTGASGFTAPNGVYARITAGPDATTGNTASVTCAGAVPTYTCTVPNAKGPGTDSVQVFYDAASAGANYQAGDPSATATIVFAGPATRTVVTPATNNAATNSTAAYTINGLDTNGAPATGSVTVNIAQTAKTSATNPLAFTDPKVTTFPAVSNGSDTQGGTQAGGYTDTETYPFTNGSATVGIASAAAGTVSLSAGTNSATFTAGTASLTVSAGNADNSGSTANNDNAKSLSLAAGGTSFINKTITDQVTVKNAAGDALGGVSVTAAVTSGPNKGAAITSGTTDQLGHATLSYPAGATAGTDALQAWVNQDTNAVNTAAADPGEPQDTTTVNLVAEPAGLTLTSTLDKTTKEPLTTTTQAVTYTLKDGKGNPASGFTLDFAIDKTSTPAGKTYTVTPTSGVTDANGQVTVTVGNAVPAAGDTIVVDASLHGDAAGVKDNNVTLAYQKSTAKTLTLTPPNQSLTAGSTVTETATLVDQFGTGISGTTVNFAVTGRNGPATNPNSTGTCTTDASGQCSFSYTDVGTPIPAGTTQPDMVNASTATLAAGTATVTFQASVTATKIKVAPATTSTTVSPDPTTARPKTAVTTITATPTYDSGKPLFNKTVTFSSTGVGTFTDSKGAHSTGASASVKTDSTGVATVYVRSADPGTQTITATADNVSGNATVNYTADYAAVTPTRVVDTRSGQGAVTSGGGTTAPVKLAPNTLYYFNYGAVDMPLDQEAYAFNITAIDPSGQGNLRVADACSTGGAPSTSLVNYQKGVTSANFAVVPNDSDCNQMVLYSAGSSASVAIDLVGYYAAGAVKAVAPTRIVDTRTGLGGQTGALTPGVPQSFQVSGTAGIPANAKAVALNVTAIGPTGVGNLEVYPDGAAKPTASSINYITGADKAAFVIVDLPANGKIDVVSNGHSANLAIDAYAYYPAGSSLVTQAPVRILDTRSTSELAQGTPLNVQVGGKGGVPADAQAVLVSVTSIHVADGTGVGNLRVYPAGGTLPTVSTLNYVSKTSDVANFAIVKLGTGGQITLYSAGSPINVALDVVGYVPSGS